MSVIILLIFFSMLVAGGFLAAFLWAVRNGQYDDNYTPSVRILFDEVTPPGEKKTETEKIKKKKIINEVQNPGLPHEILRSAQKET